MQRSSCRARTSGGSSGAFRTMSLLQVSWTSPRGRCRRQPDCGRSPSGSTLRSDVYSLPCPGPTRGHLSWRDSNLPGCKRAWRVILDQLRTRLVEDLVWLGYRRAITGSAGFEPRKEQGGESVNQLLGVVLLTWYKPTMCPQQHAE